MEIELFFHFYIFWLDSRGFFEYSSFLSVLKAKASIHSIFLEAFFRKIWITFLKMK